MTRLCLFMICQVIIILLLTARDEICQSSELRPAASLALLISLCWPPALLGPFIQDPAMGSAGLSIDQTKQEWQFRMLICVTAAAAAKLTAIVIWPAENKTAKCTQRGYLSEFPVCFCLLVQTWPVEREGGIVQYWRCKLFCTLSTLDILGFVFTYEQWRDLLLDI